MIIWIILAIALFSFKYIPKKKKVRKKRPILDDYQNTDVDYFKIMGITDGRICRRCEHLHGSVFTKQEYLTDKKFHPPYCKECRCCLSPMFSFLKSHGEYIKTAKRTSDVLESRKRRSPLCAHTPKS